MIRSFVLFSSLLLASPALAEAPIVAPAAAAAATQDRFILVDGGRNFRDVGGYRTADGKQVRRGILYRSGSLGKITPQGEATLAPLHIASVIDLRTTEERSHDSVDLKKLFGPGYWTRDYAIDRGSMGLALGDPATLTAVSIRTMMNGAYRTIARDQAPSYRQLFARLAAGKGPVVVNCTAGKDRTGLATALVLTALGVPYETIKSDFLLSNGAPGMDTLQANLSGPMARLPADVAAPLIGVDGAYLDTAFAQMRQDYGSVEGFMQKELGVGPREIAAMRRRMLEN